MLPSHTLCTSSSVCTSCTMCVGCFGDTSILCVVCIAYAHTQQQPFTLYTPYTLQHSHNIVGDPCSLVGDGVCLCRVSPSCSSSTWLRKGYASVSVVLCGVVYGWPNVLWVHSNRHDDSKNTCRRTVGNSWAESYVTLYVNICMTFYAHTCPAYHVNGPLFKPLFP